MRKRLQQIVLTGGKGDIRLCGKGDHIRLRGKGDPPHAPRAAVLLALGHAVAARLGAEHA